MKNRNLKMTIIHDKRVREVLLCCLFLALFKLPNPAKIWLVQSAHLCSKTEALLLKKITQETPASSPHVVILNSHSFKLLNQTRPFLKKKVCDGRKNRAVAWTAWTALTPASRMIRKLNGIIPTASAVPVIYSGYLSFHRDLLWWDIKRWVEREK